MLGMYFGMWSDGPIGVTLAALITLFVGFVIILTLYGIFILLDSAFMVVKDGVCTVVGKKFIEEHTTTTTSTINGITTVNTVHHDDEWILTVKIGVSTDTVSVSERLYDDVFEGVELDCKYTNGRLVETNIYVKEVSSK